jgi:hypothetical protein
MKFIFADALDMIDPDFDFEADRMSETREMYWGDVYPHEYFRTAPYDGLLVSRGIVGDDLFPGKYPADLMMRFRRIGARAFLRLSKGRLSGLSIFGDCGAFSYSALAVPPYTPDMMLDFYADGAFTHGCSVDHVIFDFDESASGLKGGSSSARQRFDITLENASGFLRASRQLGRGFTPLGVVQGWSPASMAHAARRLERMGYTYLAVGGMVPLNARQIHLCLQAIRTTVSSGVRLHLLGFAKAEQIHEFTHYGIASFDSTSPLRRAFTDARANYYHSNGNGRLDYFTAIRIPQATENPRLKRKAKASGSDQERLILMEKASLRAVRRFDQGKATLSSALRAVIDYGREFLWDSKKSAAVNELSVTKAAAAVRRTLESRPWTKCTCRVCREAGIETIIFRGSNRNKRRGFHNLAVYHNYLKRTLR